MKHNHNKILYLFSNLLLPLMVCIKLPRKWRNFASYVKHDLLLLNCRILLNIKVYHLKKEKKKKWIIFIRFFPTFSITQLAANNCFCYCFLVVFKWIKPNPQQFEPYTNKHNLNFLTHWIFLNFCIIQELLSFLWRFDTHKNACFELLKICWVIQKDFIHWHLKQCWLHINKNEYFQKLYFLLN